ncbi:methyltransferase domain-containing protein [Mucilaginibacter psychrotolerans]|uniref:Methyltransferase domain-containing protein n=1 Tax=Mucilaginibacter psychrotolerans TaxID=1524096 RepID=A0A4Y8SB51_9SPHI|nr:methyltransferase domain-containing protein [Mucilaginibacter psychrotolerans]TFF36122.1 methyltransferase domain-containing protein [Mucilaginibacter psychrotolerans]
MKKNITEFILEGSDYTEHDNYYEFKILRNSTSIKANVHYFNNEEWAEEYLTFCHRSDNFKNRWEAAVGDLTDKVIIDIGCGPGNVFATLKGNPRLLIGVDVAGNSFSFTKKYDYTGVLADAHCLPFKSGIADIVTLNATLHHCENMDSVLKEAARLVKPGGLLVTDHDPQYSAWNYKGIARILWNARVVYYNWIGRGFHKSTAQQKSGLACETHHKPGHGVTKELFFSVFEAHGFKVNVFPHNHEVGASVLNGEIGLAEFKYKLGNLLSGRNPFSKSSALSLMCVARKSA